MLDPIVFFFGDQIVEKLPSIQRLFEFSTSSPLIHRFLDEVTEIIRSEASALPIHDYNIFPPSKSLLNIAEENAGREYPDEVIAATLMCVGRIGELIIYAENMPDLLYSVGSRIHTLALCTGVLPAAILAVARDTNELVRCGVEITAIAFRLACQLALRSQRIEETPGSWAYTLIGIDASQLGIILDTFHQEQRIPPYKRCFVAVLSETWTTIFGPPSVLAVLSSSARLSPFPKLRLNSGAAVHASHLPPLDISSILGHSHTLNKPLLPLLSNAPIISPSTAVPYDASDLRDLLTQAIEDIAQNQLKFDDTIQSLVSNIKGCGVVRIVVVGPTPHTSALHNALEAARVKVQTIPPIKFAAKECESSFKPDDVAIVGMSGKFPGCDNVQGLWDTVINAKDLHQQIPETRFSLHEYFDPDGAQINTTTTPYGCFLERPGQFDTRLFDISPREAMQMDPLQRLLLMVTYEALEMAGYSQEGGLLTDSKRVATYIGQVTDDWRDINESQGIDIYYIPGVARAFTAGRLNYNFKWEGGSYSLDSACASSSAAVTLACSALLAGECDTAVAGGGSILLSPAGFAGLSRGGFLSATGNCKTFRNDADGYCRGEGIGTVILKRFQDAVADNDNILALIKGYAKTYSADTASMTHPHIASQAQLYSQVLQRASVKPEEINYVEVHGTGTRAGDVSEMKSITQVFGNGRSRENPLYFGSVKANIGHGEAAAGVTALIKTVLMLQNDKIPCQPHMPFQLNHEIAELESINLIVPTQTMAFSKVWPSRSKRRILMNSFDASGGNVSVVIENAPVQQRKAKDPRTHHVIVCSARTSFSLNQYKKRLIDFLLSMPDTKLCDIAYTTTARRLHEKFRSSFTASSTADLCSSLTKGEPEIQGLFNQHSATKPSIVFIFTGQGSFHPGLGSLLFSTCPQFRNIILSYQHICDNQGFPDVRSLVSDDSVDLKSTSIVQHHLALVFLELALADLLISWGVRPKLLIGHSLGEYSALCVSKVLSISDTFYLVAKRAELLQNKCSEGSHAMLAIATSAHTINEVLTALDLHDCNVACFNAPTKTVVSGPIKSLQTLQNAFAEQNVLSSRLNVSHGFHSSQMNALLAELEDCARSVVYAKPRIPIASTLTCEVIQESGTFSSEYIFRQTQQPVQFLKALEALVSKQYVDKGTIWIETGPGHVCLDFVRSTLDVPASRLLPTIEANQDNWLTISRTLAQVYSSNVNIKWKEFHRQYSSALTLVDLPSYAFDVKDYWAPYTRRTKDAHIKPEAETQRMLSTCLQHVIEEHLEEDHVSATFVSYTSNPMLFNIIQSHLVDGTALCPASVFCDMAFTAAHYIHAKLNPGKEISMRSIMDLETKRPLLVPTKNPKQIVEVRVVKRQGCPSEFDISLASKDDALSIHHASCRVVLSCNDEDLEAPNAARLVKRRVEQLKRAVTPGFGHQIRKPVFYRLFTTLVNYGTNYQNVEEVILDEDCKDAVAKVRPKDDTNLGTFTCSPYCTDSIVHLAGFLLNCNLNKSNDLVYIFKGFESLLLYEELHNGSEYAVYADVSDGAQRGLFWGETWVLKDNRVVARCKGIQFSEMNKVVLSRFLRTSAENNMPLPEHQAGSFASSGKTPPLSQPKGVPSSDAPIAMLNPAGKAICQRDLSVRSFEQASKHHLEDDQANQLLRLVASETGVAIDEMETSTPFSAIGVDSLMTIAIVGAAQRKIGLELPASFFADHPTVGDVRQRLGTPPKMAEPLIMSCDASSSPTSGTTLEYPNGETKAALHLISDEDQVVSLNIPESIASSTGESLLSNARRRRSSDFSCDALLIQRGSSPEATPLFLIPGGVGSATIFIHLTRLPSGNPIYALQSPFLNAPREFTCTLREIASIFISRIRATQPQGPYIVGGYSVGAAHAYEVAHQLLGQGEQLLGLIIIDMHVPRLSDVVEAMVEDLADRTDTVVGMCRPGLPPKYPMSPEMKRLLVANVKALMKYSPEPMTHELHPKKTFVVWAEKGVADDWGEEDKRKDGVLELSGSNPMDGKAANLKTWYLASRANFGANGWDALVGEIECHTVDANHFSILKPPNVTKFGQKLAEIVAQIENHPKRLQPSR